MQCPVSLVEYPLLSKINSPSDLRGLPVERLPEVCAELRSFLISNLSHNPGHFASSMGAIEIIVALHYVYDTPTDHIVYDVGHQAYSHKILTGRRDKFAKQRTKGGISGFPSPAESIYDTFTAGHAGNSISAALGMAVADRLTPGHEHHKTVAVIGDASISGGLAFEGLNNVSNSPNNLLIILNDNDMSIDSNVGALHHYLSEITTSKGYNRLRNRVANYFKRKGMLDDHRKGILLRFNNSLKALISHQQNIFEGLNIRYFGPFDGHNVEKIVKILQEIKDMEGPRLLHLQTIKGKGYDEAEKDPTTWHAPGKFDPATGKRIKSDSLPKWQDVFGDTLVELATEDNRIVGVTAAMPSGTSMIKLSKAYPARTFDTGISEGHAVTFSGGLAAAGKRPFTAIYSSFLQRAYDNIIHDVAIQGLPVTFCIDRAGIVGEDGVTHHGMFDLAYLGCIPGMKIASPADPETLRSLMRTSLEQDGPMAIRYPRGSVNDMPEEGFAKPISPLKIGKGRKLLSTPEAKTALLTIGPLAHEAMVAAERLRAKGIPVDIYDMIWLKPIDKELLQEIAKTYDFAVTVEDGAISGGFGQKAGIELHKTGHCIDVTNLGIPDRWIHHGTPAELYANVGIDAAGIEKTIESLLQVNSESTI
ncbi:MAG: 1-deoxy-D-xylulose-5-phosphate synthase [Prevotella sp.]|nr:1-deoxy-D-xylulose-5-phosphate synthase [Prevotella sp.]MCM1475117.1 1-deoxy-D-xylulose-5-phosphate synthase [Muribaculaceae bacterium]